MPYYPKTKEYTRATYFIVQVEEDGEYLLNRSGIDKYKAVRMLRKLREENPDLVFYVATMRNSTYIEDMLAQVLTRKRRRKFILPSRDEHPPF